ncbi:hypothetical protein CALVIDRAFT_230675 [Calocera viscosa TUFC12733]|uniref:EKC/KEOPS complex subunit GON7 n=1 Tax=Calocera viscosa (strain TUFC12733) TaxID=1330018 RepID=A0A167JWF4_CALVF|nr:hypothetical protein CALVIDRAFT_230675 [Calocera viscosa TUFC12733]
MSKAVVIDLKLDLPKATVAPTQAGQPLPASTRYTYPIALPSKPGNNEYYGTLRAAIAAAKDDMGAKLTAWRDAVGDGEKEKEVALVGKKKAKQLEEMEDEEEEDEDEE